MCKRGTKVMKSHESPDKTVESAIRKVAEAGNPGLQIMGPKVHRQDEILTPEALGFVADLVHHFQPRLKLLLKAREARQARFDAGELPDFRLDTRSIRESDW